MFIAVLVIGGLFLINIALEGMGDEAIAGEAIKSVEQIDIGRYDPVKSGSWAA